MKKIKGIIFALVTLIPFAGISYFLYSNFPTTPVLIIILVILMTGVLIAYRVYHLQTTEKSEKNSIENQIAFPKMESNLIYVSPAEFCSKLEKITGNLFLIGAKDLEKEVTIVEGTYNKLKDELVLKFTGGIKIILIGIEDIAVGNEQFAFFYYKEMILVTNKQRTVFYFENAVLSSAKSEKISVPRKKPLLVFYW